MLELSLSSDLDTIRQHWCSLTDRYSHSFYQSWDWVSTWIESLSEKTSVQCRIFMDNDHPVLGYFVGWQKKERLPYWPELTAYLNETGIAYQDGVTVEQNGILGSSDALKSLIASNAFFPSLRCPELYVRFSTAEFKTILERHSRNTALFFEQQPSYYVDLDSLRLEGKQFDECLSRNRRQQIRRSIRKYESESPLKITVASSIDQALWMLDALSTLHQATWTERGHSGSFSNGHFLKFHRRLIERCFLSNEPKVFICEIASTSDVVGYIYGFLHNQHFLFYQSGFNYHADNRFKPGFVSHYLLIQYFLEQGLSRYDFLAGGADYKKSLATNIETCYHIVARERNIITSLLRAKRYWHARRTAVNE